MVFVAFPATFLADCGKRLPTEIDSGRSLSAYRSPPLRTIKTDNMHGKVGAQAVYVLKHVDDWFLVL